MNDEDGGLPDYALPLIVVAVCLVAGIVYVQTRINQKTHVKQAEKVYASDEGSQEAVRPANPTLADGSASAPAVRTPERARQSSPGVEDSPVLAIQSSSPPRVEIHLSPNARRGPPVDLFAQGLDEDDSSDEEAE